MKYKCVAYTVLRSDSNDKYFSLHNIRFKKMGFTKKWTHSSPAIRKHELGWRRRVCRHCGCFVAAGTEQLEWSLTCG